MSTYQQTSRGSVAFVLMTADTANGAQMPSQVHLQDGVTVRPNALTGTVTVRSTDVAALQATGLILSGASSQAAFQAGVITGTGAGTAT